MSSLLLILLPCLLLGSVLSTVAGGGLGILMIALGSFFLPVQQNIAVMSVLLLAMQLSKLWHFHPHVRWDIVRWYLVLGIPFSALGAWLLFVVDTHLVSKMLGVFLLLVFVRELYPSWRIRVDPKPATLLIGGAVNGFLGGLVGNGGGIRSQMLLSAGIRKAAFVGTTTAIALPMNVAKSGIYVTQIIWSPDIVMLFVFGLPLILIGVWIGKALLHYVRSEDFAWCQRLLIGAAAIKFLLF